MVGTGPFRYGAGKGTSGHAAVEPPERLVGHEGARNQDADAVHRRHPQHAEHRVAAELPAEQHRPEQQLLPGDREADRREGADVLHEGAVHALGEHGVARSEHDEEAAQRPGLPPCTRDVDQRRPDRERRVREDRREGEPDGPPAHVEQVDRQGAGRQAGLQVQHRGREGAAHRQRVPRHEQRRLRREQGRVEHQPPDHRAERMVRLDDGDPDHLGEREERGHPAHARLPRLQRARRRAELGQVRPRHQQRQAARPDAVHVLRLPLPPAGRGVADVRELLTVHRERARRRGRSRSTSTRCTRRT